MSPGVFWLLVAGLAVLGAAFVIWPLRRGSGADGVAQEPSRDDTARALYRARLQELARERELGQLDAADHEAAVAELGRGLIADTSSGDGSVATAGLARWGWLPALMVGAATALLAAGLYWRIGLPDAAAMAEVGAMVRAHDLEPAQLLRYQDTLERHLARRPGDAESWYLLGHVHLQASRYTSAQDAFRQALTQQGGTDANIKLYLLQARYLAASGRLDEESEKLVEEILSTSPNHPLVLEILAMNAFRSESYGEAVSILNRALSNPLSPMQRASLQVGLRQARERMGDAQPGVDVQIEGLAAAPPRATLFVIARPVGGGMPYAVVRRPGPDYPQQVRLDDAVSMSPANPLSAAENFEVVVRLSMTGAVQAHAGDWQWRSQPLSLGDTDGSHALAVTLRPEGNQGS